MDKYWSFNESQSSINIEMPRKYEILHRENQSSLTKFWKISASFIIEKKKNKNLLDSIIVAELNEIFSKVTTKFFSNLMCNDCIRLTSKETP